ncbi:MAG: response regulator [Deltaproteobacteria bacterium]|nr:response regulator [Deltaproteobacteria bacterium]
MTSNAPKILVVEDNPTTRKMLRVALEAESWSVIEAEDGETALRAVATQVPALVLLDLVLPDADGVELARQLRAIPALRDVPILALSGFLSKMDEARTSGSAFTAFLVKPIEPDRLVEIVQSYMPAPPARKPSDGTGKRVLVVDDDPVQLRLAALHLASAGFEVRVAPDGARALALARAETPHVVVSDILMPGMDGFELCLQIRRDWGLRGVPVVLTSVHYVAEADQELARRVGASRLVQRSPDHAELCAAVAQSIAAGPTHAPSEGVDVIRGDHAARVIRQLERQVGLNAGLAQRCAVQAAELSLLYGVTDALSRSADIDAALRDVLASCLDAAGISRGGLFIAREDGKLELRHAIGYREADRAALEGFFGHPEILEQAFGSEVALHVPSASVAEDAASEILERASVTSILLVPLVSAGSRLGAFFAGSAKADFAGADRVAFIRALAAQIGQTVALTMAFARVAQSERRYRALMEHANDGIAVAGTDGKISQANEALARLSGKRSHELVGTSVLDLVAAREREWISDGFASLRPLETIRSGDVRMVGRDGREVTVDFSATLVETGAGRVILTVVRDMTERRAIEDALRASEARFRGLVEAMDDVVVTLDAGGRHTGAFGRWLAREGALPEHYVGKTSREIFGPDAAAVHEEAAARTLGGENVVYEWAREDPKGTKHFQTSLSPMRDGSAEVTGILAVSRDVTGQKKIQGQLMMSDRMVSVGMLAAGVAHEINNPLAGVIANLDLAIHDVADMTQAGIGTTGDLCDELKDAREAADRVRQIVRDLKLFSRAEEERRGPVDIQRVLESSLRMAQNEIRHRARLSKSFGDVPPVEGNESRLGQVFLNLIVNAAQAIPEGRASSNQISVATGLDEKGRVSVSIADTGSGMPPEVVARLFTPFFTTKPAGQGTGLGLSICHRIVTSLGGEIAVESQPGKGTTFRVTLPPAAAESLSPPPPIAASALAARRGRILVVDDEPMICRMVQRVLGRDHDVLSELDAGEALARIRAGERFDVILCDIMMPVVTGLELHAELLRSQPDQAERIVFLTGGAFTPSARAFLDEVPNLRIEKPFEPSALRSIVNSRVR